MFDHLCFHTLGYDQQLDAWVCIICGGRVVTNAAMPGTLTTRPLET